MDYKIREITPKEMRCIAAACPAIYEITPKEMMCALLSCPAIYNKKGKDYYIIGEKVVGEELKALGLEKKVGANEVMIKIDKRIIDDRQD